ATAAPAVRRSWLNLTTRLARAQVGEFLRQRPQAAGYRESAVREPAGPEKGEPLVVVLGRLLPLPESRQPPAPPSPLQHCFSHRRGPLRLPYHCRGRSSSWAYSAGRCRRVVAVRPRAPGRGWF